MEHIRLRWSLTGWNMITNDPDTIALFRTDTIPLPYTARASASLVLNEVARNFPNALVEVVQGEVHP